MTIDDPIELMAGAPLIAIIPAMVEIAKRQGMPVRYAGLAAIVIAATLLAMAGIASGERLATDRVARWLIGGVIYGLAAAGLYSQRSVLIPPHLEEVAGDTPPD